MKFDRHPAKAESNLEKHGVSSEDAKRKSRNKVEERGTR